MTIDSTKGLIGIQFDPNGPKPDDDLNILVTLRQVGEEDFSVLYNDHGVQTNVNAEDYLQGAISKVHDEQPSRESRFSFSTILTVIITTLLIGISLAGMTNTLAFRVVLTGSMVPTINPGDLIVTLNDQYVEPKLNDVVVYIGKRFDGTDVAPFAHRLVGGDEKSGWIAKGDANPNADIQRPTAEDIQGVVIATIPGIGKFLTPQFLILLTIIGLGMWLVFDWARD